MFCECYLIVCKYSKLYYISTHDEGAFCIKAVSILLLGSTGSAFFHHHGDGFETTSSILAVYQSRFLLSSSR